VTLEELARREDTVVVSAAPGTLVLVVVLEGAGVLHDDRSTGSSLQPFDTVAVDAARLSRFSGAGRIARVVLTPVDPDRPVRSPDPVTVRRGTPRRCR
jgi:hypothetical protein